MERGGIFAGADPFALAQAWLDEATPQEPNDPNAIALATVDDQGLPDVRMVLLKEIEQREGDRDGAFLFYTNYQSAKGHEIEKNGEALDPLKPGKAAFVLHWKSLRRQVRVRGLVTREEGPKSDAYYRSRDIGSRYGAWASQQSRPLSSREALMADVAKVTLREGLSPKRPPFWGGYRIRPLQIEFWANGTFRLHDRFIWTRPSLDAPWSIERQHP